MNKYIYSVDRIYFVNVPRNHDLLEYLIDFIDKEEIKIGFINVIGSLYDVVLGYYNHESDRYEENRLRGIYELASGIGNISLKEGKPFIHLHVVLGTREGVAYAGHLLSGKVFVAEAVIAKLSGEPVERKRVSNTLWLWK